MLSGNLSAAGSAPIAIVGAACRLPGAADIGAFWELLKRGACSVTEIGNNRWHTARFYHPRQGEAGFAYTYAAGVLDDPFAFDPAAFGISPREAEQMDPQQRLLLELVWEALEDAGIRPSSLHGSNAGVYVGASSLDYGSRQMADPASIEAHFMTGNTLSIIANRISYIYGLNGPSLTVDTACSSSLVALNQAMLALESGVIDTAIVAGVNIILSPASFVGFSRAGMLSPTGRCRPFAAQADGYVRSEGAVAIVLRGQNVWRGNGERPRAMIVASAANSDGRTSGLMLPSAATQRSLLDDLYRQRGIDPEKLAFVEAHGTGTRVGDPAEAEAIGRALGQPRSKPLPLGSVKSNIGHLEPASGLAGLLKAMLALEHKHLPASLHLCELNPDIRFDELNLAPVRTPLDLIDLPQPLHAGVSSFGFGGTNAHVVLRAPNAQEHAARRKPKHKAVPELLLVSAHTPEALRGLSSDYGRLIAEHGSADDIAAAAARRRDLLPYRLAMPLGEPQAMADALIRHGRGDRAPEIEVARAPVPAAPVAFVYSGNGAQWAGMGRAAYAGNALFRAQFDAVGVFHREHTDWALVDMLMARDLTTRIERTSIAQPLLFAIQSALTGALAELGLRPDAVLGHSVGEVAAAEACGALSREEAVALIHRRSHLQEQSRGLGLMMAMRLPVAEARNFIAEHCPDLEIAAINSPSGVTLAGSAASITAAERAARAQRISARIIAVDYPFHSRLLEPFEDGFTKSMTKFATRSSAMPFLSTVTGAQIDGASLDAAYWWRNIREPVRFADAVQAAAALGCRAFVEIGPRPILVNNITETLAAIAGVTAMASFEHVERADGPDPVLATLARAAAHGARVDDGRIFGHGADRGVALPHYPWQRMPLRVPLSREAVDIFGLHPRHPLIGARLTDGAAEWRTTLDPVSVPYLADHKVDGDVVMPAAGFAEMALAAARDWLGAGPLLIEDFDIVHGLVFPEGAMREIAVRLEPSARVLEIFSRPRLAADWTQHVRCRIGRPVSGDAALPLPQGDVTETDGAEVYLRAAQLALDYGPAFRRVSHTRRDGKTMVAELGAATENEAAGFSVPQVLSPTAFDAALHGLFLLQEPDDQRTCLPVRIGSLRVHAPGVAAARAVLRIERESERSFTASVTLLGNDGALIAFAEDMRFQWVTLGRRARNVFFRTVPVRIWSGARFDVRATLDTALSELPAPAEAPEEWLLLLAFVRSLAHRTMHDIAGEQPASLTELVDRGALAATSVPLAASLLNALADAGLAIENNGVWTITKGAGLPEADIILQTLCADHPGRSAELVMAARAMSGLAEVLRGGESMAYEAALVEQFETQSLLVDAGIAQLRAVVGRVADAGSAPLRVLVAEPGGAALIRALLPVMRRGQIVVGVTGADANRLASFEAHVERLPGLDFIDVSAVDVLDALPPFDLALAFGMPSLLGNDRKLGQIMARALHEKGALLVLQPLPNPVSDLLLGVTTGWFSRSPVPEFPLCQLLGEDALRGTLADAEFDNVMLHAKAGPAAALAVASPRATAKGASANAAPVLLATSGAPRLTLALARELERHGRLATQWRAPEDQEVLTRIDSPRASATGPVDVVHLIGAGTDRASTALGAAILRIAARLEALRANKLNARLWLVAPDGLNGDGMATAIRAFGRVAANEYPEFDVRLVDLSSDLDDAAAASHLCAVLVSPGVETELRIDRDGVSVLRAIQGLAELDVPATANTAVRLHFAPPDSPRRLEWRAEPRADLADDEVEIEVAATGLNFRDVMFATGLLPDDILADGYAGATLGLECAGHIARIGAKVGDLKPGDPVTSFARGAFATHVTVPAALVLPVPPSMPLAAAAGIPVAFLTAWYGLIHLAKLKRDEWVLIHAAAGGVGLAALQIARWRGARVVATAGSDDKRALVRLFGADLVLDSRSLNFADDIRKSIGGVDVVLNSLAGDAMEASLKALKPFGRFVELGKRDYVANSRVGLRPFRQNLTYYGVDADQLLIHQRPVARKLNRELARYFSEGAFTPLPYRMFEAGEIDEALLLMQRASHVGKIVVRPPAVIPPQRDASATFTARPEGCHLVVGGTSGFGFETARWLASCGAKTIVVASRRGVIAPEVEQAAAELRTRGVELIAAHVDVTRRDSVDWLVHWIESQHGPLAGVIHTAMTLADGMMSDLDEAKIDSVLAPKIDGALHLDQATRHATLDYFVMYSSATTLIGNPGQASYVAANGFLEGLARRRRAEKLPALAVAWGPIADAGVLSRDAAIGARLARRTGRSGLKSADALTYLGRLLCRDPMAVDEATVACAAIDWRLASRELKILKTPMFSMLRSGAAESSASAIDIADLLDGKTDAEARDLVTDLIAAQVASILRVASSDIDPRRPLSEIGMDSLMGLELKMAVEDRFGIEVPLMAMTAGKSLADIVAHLIAELRPTGGTPFADMPVAMQQGQPLLAQHAERAVAAEGIEELAKAVDKRRKGLTGFAG